MPCLMEDSYRTITACSEGLYSEKRSKFIAVAVPVTTLDEVKEALELYRKRYCDARHLCYAYMLGPQRNDWRVNDNGEPSGTAGRPILGQINSHNLTDILILVVRYFGGIKLGTPGLTAAYKTAAAEAIAAATVVERVITAEVAVRFPYAALNEVLHLVREAGAEVAERTFEADCSLRLAIKRSGVEHLKELLHHYSVEHGGCILIEE